MGERPRGTVSFIFTDVEGSTRMWEAYADTMPVAYARHDALLRGAAAERGGAVFKIIGDAFQIAFSTAADAVSAAVAVQRGMQAEAWPTPEPIRVRMAIHTGAVDPEPDGDYRSPVLNRLGRLLGAGYGNQVLLSQTTAELTGDALPAGSSLRDLGEHRLKDLSRGERIYQLLHPEIEDAFPAIKTLDARRTNLPVQPTPFIGREGEITAAANLLRQPGVRLLTLTGPGGTGKTRLGLQVAAEATDAFPDGVFMVDLARIDDPALLVPTVAQALWVREQGDKPLSAVLNEHLADKRLLLLMDNFEHVLDAAPAVADLLTAAPALKVLTTSRARLQLRGEREFVVPPLGLPNLRRLPPPQDLEGFEAVRLFAERAREAKPGFEIGPDNARVVAEICVRLDGLPLALELAAARIKILPPAALLARLDNRLKLLSGGARDLPERQRTLRGLIAWSHDLLAEEEKLLFHRLTVFSGGCTFEAAEAVVDPGFEAGLDVLDGLSSLVDKSLLRQEDGPGGEPRFRMLEMIREFGQEQLTADGDAAEVRRRHGEHFLGLAEEAAPAMLGAGQGEALDRLEAEHDNLRGALAWATEHDGDAALRFGAALWRFWMLRGYLSEGDRWLSQALATDGKADEAVRVRSLIGAGVLAELRGEFDRARELLERARSMASESGDSAGLADALSNLGALAAGTGDDVQGEERYREAQELYRTLKDKRGLAVTLGELGSAAHRQGDLDAATTLHEDALDQFRALGDDQATAVALTNLGVVAVDRGDLERAVGLYEEALALLRGLGDKATVEAVLINLGDAAVEWGDDVGAAGFYEEALDLAREIEDLAGEAVALVGLGAVAGRRGDDAAATTSFGEGLAISRRLGTEWIGTLALLNVASYNAEKGNASRAARLFGAAAALCEATDDPCSPGRRARFNDAERVVRDALGEETFTSEWTAGRTLPSDRALAEAGANGLAVGAI